MCWCVGVVCVLSRTPRTPAAGIWMWPGPWERWWTGFHPGTWEKKKQKGDVCRASRLSEGLVSAQQESQADENFCLCRSNNFMNESADNWLLTDWCRPETSELCLLLLCFKIANRIKRNWITLNWNTVSSNVSKLYLSCLFTMFWHISLILLYIIFLILCPCLVCAVPVKQQTKL